MTMTATTASKVENDETAQGDCTICLETLKDPVIELPCRHKFCESCLNQWRSKYDMESAPTKSCPQCRQNIPPSKEMIIQMKHFEEQLAELKRQLSSSEPFVFEDAIQCGGFSKMIDHEKLQAIYEAPRQQHDAMFRMFYKELAEGFEDFIQTNKERLGLQDVDYDQLLQQLKEQNDDDPKGSIHIPKDVYDVAGMDDDYDIPKVLKWLGYPSRISKDRINAKNPDHMDNALLHLVAKTSIDFDDDVGFMSWLLQNGANVNAENCIGATAIETVAFRLEYDSQSRVLLEWGAKNESTLMDIVEAAAVGGNPSLAHLLSTELGGRRCEITGLVKCPDLNGKTGIAGKYHYDADRYEVVIEQDEEEKQRQHPPPVLVRTANLKRRDRTPDDCGPSVYQYDANTGKFTKKFVGKTSNTKATK